MIPIPRFPEPSVLTRHKQTWTQDLLEKRKTQPSARPESKRYAHPEVKQALGTMSHWKCFYCEANIKTEPQEVDHYIEVATDPMRAFEWENLYLSCKGCNQAKNRARHIQAADCIDPCAPGVDPTKDIQFEGELIRARNGSKTGLSTIQKYGLGRAELDHKRLKWLQHVRDAVDRIKDNMIKDGRQAMSADEEELLRSFAYPDQPFSLLCKCKVDAVLTSK